MIVMWWTSVCQSIVGSHRASLLSVVVVWTALVTVATKSSTSVGAENIQNVAEGSQLYSDASVN